MVTIHQLHKSFGRRLVLRGIDLELNTPGVTAILGPNGSGKTTLMKCILGMVIPNRGSVKFNGQDIKGQHMYRSGIDYLPQIARFPENLKVHELFKLLQDLRGQKGDLTSLINAFSLQDFLENKLGTLSGGTRQKVNIAAAFMFDKAFVLLDEPTSGLDPVAMIELKKLITAEKEKGKTIILNTHIISFVEDMADRIVFLLDGRVYFDGSIRQLKDQVDEDDLEKAIASILSAEEKKSGNYAE